MSKFNMITPCNMCSFWIEYMDQLDIGECRKFAPGCMKLTEEYQNPENRMVAWPITNGGQGCGGGHCKSTHHYSGGRSL